MYACTWNRWSITLIHCEFTVERIIKRGKIVANGYSLAEEVANSVVHHGVEVIFGIVGLVLMLNLTCEAGADVLEVTSYNLSGGSMILLYLASMLYHAIPHPSAKRKKSDHCATYLIIARLIRRFY